MAKKEQKDWRSTRKYAIIVATMSPENKDILIKRLKSFAWRLGVYAAITGLAFVSDNLDLLHLSPMVTTVVALIVGEATKYLNTRYSNPS